MRRLRVSRIVLSRIVGMTYGVCEGFTGHLSEEDVLGILWSGGVDVSLA